MAYKALDSAAFAGQDDGSWSAPNLTMLWDMVSETHSQRFARCGVNFPRIGDGTPHGRPRICSLEIAAWGPFKLFLPEPTERVTIRLRVDSVENAPVNVFATCGRAHSAANAPPSDVGRWITLGGKQLAVTASATTESFTGIPVPGETSGWVDVYIWTQSELKSAAEETGTFSSTVIAQYGGFELSGVTAITSNPPEMAVMIEANSLNGNWTEGRVAYQLMWYDDGRDLAWTFPRFAGIVDTTSYADTWALHKLGVVDLRGVSIEAEVDDYGDPPRDALFNSEPAAWHSHQPMARAIDTMGRRRVPTWSTHPGTVTDEDPDGSDATNLLWFVRSDSGPNHAAELSTSYQTIARSGLISTEPPESNGYECYLSMSAFPEHNTDRAVPDLILRIRAVTWSGAGGSWTETATTPTADLLTVADWHMIEEMPRFVGAWRSLSYNLMGAVTYNSWQFRGALCHEPGAPLLADVLRQQHYIVTIPETDIVSGDYPIVLQLQAKLGSAYPTSIAVHGVGWRSRMIGE